MPSLGEDGALAQNQATWCCQAGAMTREPRLAQRKSTRSSSGLAPAGDTEPRRAVPPGWTVAAVILPACGSNTPTQPDTAQPRTKNPCKLAINIMQSPSKRKAPGSDGPDSVLTAARPSLPAPTLHRGPPLPRLRPACAVPEFTPNCCVSGLLRVLGSLAAALDPRPGPLGCPELGLWVPLLPLKL